MTDPIVNGLFGLAGAVIGGLVTILAAKMQAKTSELKEENEHTKKRLRKALQQIEAYHFLEDIYANKVADVDKKAARTIKTEYRNKVVEEHSCVRPDLTAKEALKQINDM